ncbi:hypothetical protein BKA63DRAFT_405086 [Paraphoma chrysanthemicola]|nr:hypothetical protein BKA63DRAFT_405086 [Paraphoma chrysanthemicola]
MSSPCKHTEFVADMKHALETGKYSDLTITCHNRSWAVHKIITCAQSDALEAASRFRKEAAEGIIELPGDDPDIVEHMLRHMYERDYRLPSEDVHGPHWLRPLGRPVSCRTVYAGPRKTLSSWRSAIFHRASFSSANSTQNTSILEFEFHPGKATEVFQVLHQLLFKQVNPHQFSGSEYGATLMSHAQSHPLPVATKDLAIHAKVYAIADKYFIKGLKGAAREKFEKSVRDAFASKHFYDEVDIVFSTTPDNDASLRDLVAERIMEEKIKYGLGKNDDLDAALKEILGLAFRVMQCEGRSAGQARKPVRSEIELRHAHRKHRVSCNLKNPATGLDVSRENMK